MEMDVKGLGSRSVAAVAGSPLGGPPPLPRLTSSILTEGCRWQVWPPPPPSPPSLGEARPSSALSPSQARYRTRGGTSSPESERRAGARPAGLAPRGAHDPGPRRTRPGLSLAPRESRARWIGPEQPPRGPRPGSRTGRAAAGAGGEGSAPAASSWLRLGGEGGQAGARRAGKRRGSRRAERRGSGRGWRSRDLGLPTPSRPGPGLRPGPRSAAPRRGPQRGPPARQGGGGHREWRPEFGDHGAGRSEGRRARAPDRTPARRERRSRAGGALGALGLPARGWGRGSAGRS